MSEQLKFIIQELNKEPFKKNLNLISFDSLDRLQLLQSLNDVFGEIDSKHKLDIREESPDQTAIRMFNVLRILKYKPPANLALSEFRQGLVQGDKVVVYPILEWLLQRLSELKKRAYLAKYLVKLEIPVDILSDQDVSDSYQQYEVLIEHFKEVHKQCTQLKSSSYSTAEIRRDINNMEEEKEQVAKRVERLKKKVESTPNKEVLLSIARSLRLEKEREASLSTQRMEQRNGLVHAEQRIQRFQYQIKELRQNSVGASPEGLLQRLEEEHKVNKYLVKEKLPKEISAKRKTCSDLQKVVSEPALAHSDLDELNVKIRAVNTEINQLIEKRMMNKDPMDDKLSLFRQQAAIIARKKEAAAEQLNEVRTEFSQLESELQEKQGQAKELSGIEILKGDDFKRYVNKLRGKSTMYKNKRQHLAELRAEYGVLSRTESVLKQRDDQVNQMLAAVEAKRGISGFRDAQEELEKVSSIKSEVDEVKGRTLEDISDMVKQLTTKLNSKKTALAPIIKELRPLRQNSQEIQTEYEDKKAAYETRAAGYESNRSKLEQDVKIFREECLSIESRYHYLNCLNKVYEIQQQRAVDELKAYVSPDPQEKKKSLRDQYTRKIQEQENMGKILREKQKTIRENHGPNMYQMKIWKDLQRLLECKRKCFEESLNNADNSITFTRAGPAGANAERMVFG